MMVVLVAVGALIISTGCLPRLSATGDPGHGTFKQIMDVKVGGFHRSYLVHLPPGVEHGKPRPLVVVLHGAFDTAKKMEVLTGWSRIADREGFMVVYPNGIGLFALFRHWNSGHCCGRAQARGIDDVAHLVRVISEVTERFSVDTRQVYIVGNSNGGMLTHLMAARNSALFAGAAVVSGSFGGRPTAEQEVWQVPVPQSPVPMILLHGRDDDIIPYAGGVDRRNKDGRTYLSVVAAALKKTEVNGAEMDPFEERLHDDRVERRQWSTGTSEPHVVLYTIDGWGHVWPCAATIDPRKDPDLAGFDAAEEIWAFFKSRVKP